MRQPLVRGSDDADRVFTTACQVPTPANLHGAGFFHVERHATWVEHHTVLDVVQHASEARLLRVCFTPTAVRARGRLLLALVLGILMDGPRESSAAPSEA